MFTYPGLTRQSSASVYRRASLFRGMEARGGERAPPMRNVLSGVSSMVVTFAVICFALTR